MIPKSSYRIKNKEKRGDLLAVILFLIVIWGSIGYIFGPTVFKFFFWMIA
jgi:hypothetical protein